MHEVRLTLEAHFLTADGERDVAILGAVDIRRLETLHEGHRFGDALPQLAKLFSSSAYFGTSAPASRAVVPLAKSAAI